MAAQSRAPAPGRVFSGTPGRQGGGGGEPPGGTKCVLGEGWALEAAPSKALASVPWGSSFPDASGRVRGGASGSRSLTSPRLDLGGMLRMLFAAASPRERGGETLPSRGQAQSF